MSTTRERAYLSDGREQKERNAPACCVARISKARFGAGGARGHLAAGALSHAGEVAQVGAGVDEASADGVGVACDGADDDDATALVFGASDVGDQELREQEVPEVVDAHGHLEAVLGKARLWVRGEVDGRVAHERIQGPSRLEDLEVEDERPHRREPIR